MIAYIIREEIKICKLTYFLKAAKIPIPARRSTMRSTNGTATVATFIPGDRESQ
jgi:hypothetical protein